MATNSAITFNSPIKIPISAMKNVKNNRFLFGVFLSICIFGYIGFYHRNYIISYFPKSLEIYKLVNVELNPNLKNLEIKDFSAEFQESNQSNGSIEIGQKIIHEKYGEGLIKEVQGNEITVEFNQDIGTKYLDVEWAPIKFQ